MENNKKRRNSILKKPSLNVEETDTDITAKISRRISFSGKKSVKEFRAGEEEATIWGTSYEESAEFLQANTTESGLVNVNQKRIILRNRRVVVDNNKGPRRRSSMKKTVAENDKENIFVEHPQGQAGVNELKSSDLIAPLTIKIESPVKSENLPMETQFEDKNSQTMSEPHERMNICSNTFDFINYSALSNKSIVIDHSVDVTLNDNEMQFFKFKKPITAASVSPNISLSSTRDSASPNIFSQSILMSDEDINILKMMRKDKVAINVQEAAMTEDEAKEIAARKCKALQGKESIEVDNERPRADVFRIPTKSELEIGGGKRITMHMNDSMNVTQLGAMESKSLKRKTITKLEQMKEDGHLIINCTVNSHPVLMDTSSMDINSPLRKKPMHKVTSSSMDITHVNTAKSISKEEPIRRQTIHFESAAVEESLICDTSSLPNISMEHSIGPPNSQTIYFDQNQIREDSVCQNIEPTHDISMEVSLCAPKIDTQENIEIDVRQEKTKGRPSIYEHAEMVEDSPKSKKGNENVHHQTIRTHADMIESSPMGSKPLQVKKPGIIRQTIYAAADIVTELYTAFNGGAKKRESIYAPADIEEDLKSPQKSSQKFNDTSDDASEAHINYDLERGHQKAGINNHLTMTNGLNRQVQKRQSIYASSDMIEDSPKTSKPMEAAKLVRQTIYTSADIEQDTKSEIQSSKSNAKNRESIYTASDIVEDCPKTMELKSGGQHRQSIYAAVDIVEDSPKFTKAPTINRQTIYGARLQTQVESKNSQSIYTPADIVEESPNISTTTHPLQCNLFGRTTECAGAVLNDKVPQGSLSVAKTRESIYTATDIVEDSPRLSNAYSNCQLLYTSTNKVNDPQSLNVGSKKRESIYTSTDIVEDSPKGKQTVQEQKSKVIGRQTICRLADMDEEAEPRILPLSDTAAKKRESVYTATDMIEDSPKSKNAILTRKLKDSCRQTICVLDDMDEEPVALRIPSSKLTMKKRESVYNAADMIEDSPVAKNVIPKQKSKVSCRQTICASDDMDEDPAAPRIPSSKLMKKRESVYNATDMIEDSPVAKNVIPTHKSKVSVRQTICALDDMDEEPAAPRIPSSKLMKKRESVYNATDMIEDSPVAKKVIPTHKSKVSVRQTICASDDMDEDAAPRIPSSKLVMKKHESVHNATDMIEGLPVGKIAIPTQKSKVSCRQTICASDDMDEEPAALRIPSSKLMKKRESIYNATDMIEDSPVSKNVIPTHKSKVSVRQTICALDDMDEEPAVPLLKPTAMERVSIYTAADMIEDLPKTKESNLNTKHSQSVYTPADMIEDMPTNETNRQSIYAQTDIISDSPQSSEFFHESTRRTLIVDSPNAETLSQPPPPGQRSAPKLIVRHMNLKQGISGDQAALRILKNQQAKMKLKEEAKEHDNSSIDMSIYSELPKSSRKLNFAQLNEELLRGETKAFAEERKPTMSLFARLENKTTEEIRFDSFMDKGSVSGVIMQRAKSSLKDYTMELSTRKTIDQQQQKDIEYTMELSFEKSPPKPCRTLLMDQNLSVAETSVFPKNSRNRQTLQLNECVEEERVTSNASQRNRQTIHFNHNNELDESRVEPLKHSQIGESSQGAYDALSIKVSEKQRQIGKSNANGLPDDDDTMDLSTIGSEMLKNQSNRKILQQNGMQLTNYQENDDDTMDLTTIDSNKTIAYQAEHQDDNDARKINSTKRQTINVRHEMDLDESTTPSSEVSTKQTIQINEKPPNSREDGTTLPSKSTRQTIYFNQNLEVEVENSKEPPIRSKDKRQTIHFNQDLDLEDSNEHQKSEPAITKLYTRQTILCNQDLELEDINEPPRNCAPSLRSALHDQPTCNSTKRQTNQDLKIEDTNEPSLENQTVPPKTGNICEVQAIRNSSQRQTIHFNQDLEMENSNESPLRNENPAVPQETAMSRQQFYQAISNSNKRQTIHFNQDLEIEDSNESTLTKENPDVPSESATSRQQFYQANKNSSKRQTIHFNQDLEIEDSNESTLTKENPDVPSESATSRKQFCQAASNSSKRQTIHFNQDVEIEDSNDATANKENHHFNQQPDLKDSEDQRIYKKSVIRTDLEASRSVPTLDDQLTGKKFNRQTIHFNQDLELEESGAPITASRPLTGHPEVQKIAWQTIRFNQDLELEDINTRPEKQVAHHKSQLMRSQTGKQPNRLTIHLNDDIEFDREEDTQKLAQRAALNEPLKANPRQTIHFQQNNDLEESTMQPIAMKPDPIKIFSKPRRLTIIDNQPLQEDESPEKITAPKSSFIRTLNFNEIPPESGNYHREAKFDLDTSVHGQNIQTKAGESSLHQLWSKGTVSKISSKLINEELPETNIPPKSSFIRTLNFNEIPSEKTKPAVFDMDISVQDKNTLEQPDDSPLYSFSAKSKGSETTSEIDRSLAEYLKAEAAATLFRSESPNLSVNMSLVAHNNPTVLGRKTTHERVNIFDDSGMQPLPNNRVDSMQDMQTKLMQMKTTSGSKTTLEHSQMNVKPNSTQLNTQPNLKPNTLTQSTTKLQHKTIITSVPMNEDCDESIELHEEPVQLKNPNHHKTIHFTNEDAVDESFFDENLPKSDMLKAQPNRKTIFFNGMTPTAEMDVTLSITKSPTISKARQSMNEILLESNKLFTTSRLLQPMMFENKRSTIYFAGKDNSMDVSTDNENMYYTSADVECITPTKNKSSRSRIPQLIDSAKKLQSIKKSMDIIEQELPNIGNQIKIENCTPHKAEASHGVARNLQESLNNAETQRKTFPHEEIHLQESFDTMAISKNTTMHAEQQKPFIREFLNETFDTVEIPRSVVPPQQLQESFDTIEIPRRATTFQKNDTLYLCPNESINATQKSIYKFEDVPITISDVSTFFTQKPLPTCDQGNEAFSPNTTQTLRTLNVNRLTVGNQLPNLFDLEDTANNLDIDKTRLSLVNTLDEQETEMLSHHGTMPEFARPTEPVEHLDESLKAVPSVCRKCHRHRLSVTHNETTIGSFMMYQRPVYKIDLAAIEELGTKPKIFDVDKVWRQRVRESDSFNIPEASRSTVLDDEDTLDEFISDLDKGRLAISQQQQKKVFQKESSFTNTLRNRMKSTKSNWILNELLLASNIIKFTHLRIRTFAICISFTPKDPRGIQVNFNEIKLVANVAHARRWKPFEYALHYQLFVELPFDLRKLCPTSDHLFQLLEHVEEVTQDVLKTGRDMLYLILASPASLIREPSGSLYIRKYARTKNSQKEVRRIEFHIEVQNMKNVSYKSIVEPPLYEFDEQIQTLPVGNEFLRVFLANPMQYLKM